MLQRHKVGRLNFTQNVIIWVQTNRYKKFSDNKCNFDGSDWWKNYWQGLKREKVILSKHQLCAGSVMTWGHFVYNGGDLIPFISSKMNPQAYQRDLASHLLLNATILVEEYWKYQQDNAPVHSNDITKVDFKWTMLNLLIHKLSR